VGNDSFLFTTLNDSGVLTPDLIADFAVGSDRIRISSIDANIGLDGHQAFAFIGTAAFSAAGQARYYQSGGDTYVELNADGSLSADATIQLTGLHTLVAGSFIL
jgi:hypothetical protein